MGGDPEQVTVSGFSGGAYMATNMHVIYSSLIKGAGLIAGGPYGPSSGHYDSGDRTESSIEAADRLAEHGYIDPTVNLAGAPVFILTGWLDPIVPKSEQDAVLGFYEHY